MLTKFHLSRRISAARLFAFGVALIFSITSSSAQIFSPLHTFTAASGFGAPVTQGPDGTLYGVSSTGGLGRAGTVFRLNPDGTHFAILYSFGTGVQFGAVFTNADGYGPAAGLVLSNNVLYGTTKYGGVTGYGTVFKINTDGSGFATLHFFTNGVGGGTLDAGLVLGAGALYGTTYTGGTNSSSGTIFALNTDGTGFTNLHSFGGTNGTFPMASMILFGSTLYGTTQEGGSGTVFKMDTNGANFAVLHHFTSTFAGTNTDGNLPEASLMLSGNTLYGTASGGGRGNGTIFAVDTDGSGFTNLYNFTNGVDGADPVAGVTLSGNTLYGTTKSGGVSPGYGTIFSINIDGSDFTSLYQFPGRGGPAAPAAALVLSNSTLFGTAGNVIFSINTNATNITVLSDGSEGAQPMGGLVLSGDTAYGTTSAGGDTGSGTIYRVKTNGTGFDTLYTFSALSASTNSDGANPHGTLVLTGGRLYGTAGSGGTLGDGAIFSISTNGTGFTNLHNFTGSPDGSLPVAELALGGDTLYGTTGSGGDFNVGTIFKINTDGSGYARLYSFNANSPSNTDGYDPRSGLVPLGDTLYGTAYAGGTNGSGTLFKINTNGANFTLMYTFVAPAPHTIDTVNVNGANPVGTLILSGSTLYGTASSGGTGGSTGKVGATRGTIFKINTDGSGFTLLYAFDGSFDGSVPAASLALSGNLLYGTGSGAGSGGAGTVFQSDMNGSNFTTLHTFPFQGGTPLCDLIVAGGVVYGTSQFSVPGSGSVFALTPTAVPRIQFTATPTGGIPPQAVQFSAPAVDDKGNTILGWYWNFDDGTPTFTITFVTNRDDTITTNYNYTSTQNPLHTYTNNGTYAPSLIATNNNGTTVLGFGPAIVIAYPTSILNGGFEAGSFTNWTRTGNFGSSSISGSALYRHSGTYGAQLFASGTLGYLSQTISTTPGQQYLVSLWLDVTNVSTANEFLVNWGGTTFMDQTNIPKIGWTNIQFRVTATSNTTLLQLGYRNDSAYFGLDDVSVISAQPVITKFTLSGTNIVLNNTGGLSNQTYYVLRSTNAAAPLNLWTPIATNLLGTNGNFSLTVTNAIDPTAPREFYIIQMQ